MAKYAVVEFIKSNTVDIVPVSWLSSEEDKSAWPPFKSDKVGPLVRELHEADSTWKYHAVKVLGKAETYERAREKLCYAEVTSDINTDCDEKRKRKEPRHYSDSDSETEPSTPCSHITIPEPPASLIPTKVIPAKSAKKLVTTTRKEPRHYFDSDSETELSASHSRITIPEPPASTVSTKAILHKSAKKLVTTVKTPSAHALLSSSAASLALPTVTTTNITNTQTLASSFPVSLSVSHAQPTQDTEPEAPASSSSAPSLTTDMTPTSANVQQGPARNNLGILVRVLALLEEVKETQRVQGGMLQAVLRQLSTSKETAVMPDGLCLPLQTMTEFDDVNARASEMSFQNAFAAVISDIGGRTLDEAVRRAMMHLMTNRLAAGFNVFGRHGKQAFGSSNIFKVLLRALKNNPQVQATQKDVEISVSKWLTGARDRDGQRTARAKAEKRKREQLASSATEVDGD